MMSEWHERSFELFADDLKILGRPEIGFRILKSFDEIKIV